MKKRARKKASARRSTRVPKSLGRNKKSFATLDGDGKLTLNHAMVYVKDVERGLAFYRNLLGFKLIEDFRFENKPVYARLRAPGGDGRFALHQAGRKFPF
jgi:hypothetical protein